jgi:hypothetical protein
MKPALSNGLFRPSLPRRLLCPDRPRAGQAAPSDGVEGPHGPDDGGPKPCKRPRVIEASERNPSDSRRSGRPTRFPASLRSTAAGRRPAFRLPRVRARSRPEGSMPRLSASSPQHVPAEPARRSPNVRPTYTTVAAAIAGLDRLPRSRELWLCRQEVDPIGQAALPPLAGEGAGKPVKLAGEAAHQPLASLGHLDPEPGRFRDILGSLAARRTRAACHRPQAARMRAASSRETS